MMYPKASTRKDLCKSSLCPISSGAGFELLVWHHHHTQDQVNAATVYDQSINETVNLMKYCFYCYSVNTAVYTECSFAFLSRIH